MQHYDIANSLPAVTINQIAPVENTILIDVLLTCLFSSSFLSSVIDATAISSSCLFMTRVWDVRVEGEAVSVEDRETPRQPYQVPVKTYVKVVKQINIQSF